MSFLKYRNIDVPEDLMVQVFQDHSELGHWASGVDAALDSYPDEGGIIPETAAAVFPELPYRYWYTSNKNGQALDVYRAEGLDEPAQYWNHCPEGWEYVYGNCSISERMVELAEFTWRECNEETAMTLRRWGSGETV